MGVWLDIPPLTLEESLTCCWACGGGGNGRPTIDKLLVFLGKVLDLARLLPESLALPFRGESGIELLRPPFFLGGATGPPPVGPPSLFGGRGGRMV